MPAAMSPSVSRTSRVLASARGRASAATATVSGMTERAGSDVVVLHQNTAEAHAGAPLSLTVWVKTPSAASAAKPMSVSYGWNMIDMDMGYVALGGPPVSTNFTVIVQGCG